jgi:hypothetical protein
MIKLSIFKSKTFKPSFNSRKGMAIVLALIVSFVLLVMFMALNMRQSNTAAHNKLTLQDRQATFAARAAMQHFLLKIKLFPTELYDAVELVQGKNPMCDFTEFDKKNDLNNDVFAEYAIPGKKPVYIKIWPNKEFDINNQPKYFYHSIPGKDAFIRLGSFNNPDYRFLLKGSATSDPKNKYLVPNAPGADLKPDKYLKYYIRDITNTKALSGAIQPTLEMIIDSDLQKIKDFDIAKTNGYPYTLNYFVSDVKIQTIEGLRKYGEEAIEVVLEGTVTDFQGKSKSQIHKRVQKITRRGSVDS